MENSGSTSKKACGHQDISVRLKASYILHRQAEYLSCGFVPKLNILWQTCRSVGGTCSHQGNSCLTVQ